MIAREPFREINFASSNFNRAPILCSSSAGTPYTRMVPIGMPRIPENVLNCVVYLYSSEEDAQKGREFGGTGFLVSVPSRHPNRAYIYVVTNWHVAISGGASVVRVNRIDGGIDVFSFEPHEWTFDVRYDIAVIAIPLDLKSHKFAIMPIDGLVSRDHAAFNRIGVGDDVFMVGRFIDHDGGPINRPAVRFGNISVLPSPIEQPNGKMEGAYCIDLHSRSGYSGSPVFIYRTPGFDLEEKIEPDLAKRKILTAGVNYLGILGIHFSQFPELWEISAGVTNLNRDAASVPLVTEGRYVKGLSGMTCVLPAWCILDVLNLPKLANVRENGDNAEEERLRKEVLSPTAK